MSEVKSFNLPDVGEGLTEAEILGWRVGPGDEVTVNQTIVEIETAKASVELPCPYDGVVGELLVDEGQMVEVGTPIITIAAGDATPGEAAAGGEAREPAGTSSPQASPDESQPLGDAAGEDRSVLVGYGPRARSARRRPRKERPTAGRSTAAAGHPSGQSASSAQSVPAEPAEPAEPAASTASTTATAAAPSAQPGGGSEATREGESPAAAGTRVAVLAKPPVRKLAKDLGVDLTAVTPSGPGGTITRDDVSAAAGGDAGGGQPAPATAPASAPPAAAFDARREQRVPIKGVRKHTAAAMVSSAFTAPHVTEFLTVDATPTVDAVEGIQRLPEFADVRVSPLLLAAKTLLLAVRRNPMVNSTWDEEAQEIVVKEYVNLGIAVASSRGLVVPNVKGAESMALPQLAGALQDMVRTARDGKTPPRDMQGGTITITNVGVFGVDTGTPILNPGEAAILALGAIREQPWVHEGQVVPRQVVQLSLSFDHRIVDGELGSKFLADIGTMLGDPTAMLAWG